jgi:hypothetical protein
VNPETYVLRDLQATATIHTGAARPTVLEVAYQGTEPPLELFSALEMVGVTGLVPQPPPSNAIDWGAGGSTPTIRPYPAVASVVLADSGRVLDAARLIVERLATTEEPAVAATSSNLTALPLRARPEPGAEASPSASLPPPPLTASTTSSAPLPPPAVVSEGRGVTVVVDVEAAADIRTLLGRHGQVLDEEPTTWTAKVAYRGQTSETHHRAVRLRGCVPADGQDEFLAELSRHRLRALELQS